VGRAVIFAALVAVLAATLAGCKVDAVTTIRVYPNGGGAVTLRVTLDPDAVNVVQRGGGTLEQRLVLTDLSKSGWRITPWTRRPDGSAEIQLTHSFRNQHDLAQVLAAMSGADGILRDPEVIRSRNFVRDRDGMTIVADLSSLKSGVRSDPALASRLRSEGVDVAAVDFALAKKLKDAFSLALTLKVPHDKTRTFRFHAGDHESVDLASSNIHWNRVMLLMIGLILVFLAMLLYLSASISARRRRARELEFASARARRSSQPLM
jgi:hypothetical protein